MHGIRKTFLFQFSKTQNNLFKIYQLSDYDILTKCHSYFAILDLSVIATRLHKGYYYYFILLETPVSKIYHEILLRNLPHICETLNKIN